MNNKSNPSILGAIFFPEFLVLSHSFTRKVVNGEPITGGWYFLAMLGWGLFQATVIGPWIYLAVKWSEIKEVRERAYNLAKS